MIAKENPILIPNAYVDALDKHAFYHLMAQVEHAHELETGKCIKNRFGPTCNMDPFLMIEGETPHTKQQEFVAAITSVVNAYLSTWGYRSGKTKARLFLAKAIIEGDA